MAGLIGPFVPTNIEELVSVADGNAVQAWIGGSAKRGSRNRDGLRASLKGPHEVVRRLPVLRNFVSIARFR
jgi:hypothetical protein